MSIALPLIFFFSGVAALVFETLWMRLAGLALGNSVWASSIVLASFMAGLAIGNALAVLRGARFRSPLRAYAWLEVLIGCSGLALVVALPSLTPVLAPLLGRVAEWPWLLNATRLLTSFLLLLVPTTAMGLTLPLLAKTLAGAEERFGVVLGRLYGWNTLGALAGALAGELWLFDVLGLRGSGFFAAALDLAAAAGAFVLAGRSPVSADASRQPAAHALPLPAQWLVASAFLCGATLLALEVVWFRFLQLFVFGSALVFATMLAVVLSGIAAGGLLAGQLLARAPRADRWLPVLVLLAGLCTHLTYVTFQPLSGYSSDQPLPALWLSFRLMWPTSLISGVLFTLLGAALRRHCGEDARSAGWLTLANTAGATCGALAAGFLLLPSWGIEVSLFGLGLLYGAVALLLWPGLGIEASVVRLAAGGAALPFTLVAALFPFGLLRGRHIDVRFQRQGDESVRVTVREGLTETLIYVQSSWGGELHHLQLFTNGHSMSATDFRSSRYMRLFVYWGLALQPHARSGLLICYGVGNTARALAESPLLESIDVVDVSRDVLAMGHVLPPAPSPLRDPRVEVHVEDGRFFLQTTRRSFDLITAEPPPPRGAGVVNLYSREYFDLIRARLAPGGVVTYWVPVLEMDEAASKSITRAFCSAFPDCTLWTGSGLEWMLAGTNGLRGAPSAAEFARQWSDPRTGPALSAIGLEVPEQLGALFLADAPLLETWTRDSPPLDDDHPQRLSSARRPTRPGRFYDRWMDVRTARDRFVASAFVREHWPDELRSSSLPYFEPQRRYNQFAVPGAVQDGPELRGVYDVLTQTSLRTLPLVMMGSDPRYQEIARQAATGGYRDPWQLAQLGFGALARRDYVAAADFLLPASGQSGRIALYRAFALALAGKRDAARVLLQAAGPRLLADADRDSARWLAAQLDDQAR